MGEIKIPGVLNGVRLPNWFWLLLFGLTIGWQAATAWGSAKSTQDKLKESQDDLGKKIEALQTVVSANEQADEARANAISSHLEALDARTQTLAMQVDWRSQQVRNSVGVVTQKVEQLTPDKKRH